MKSRTARFSVLMTSRGMFGGPASQPHVVESTTWGWLAGPPNMPLEVISTLNRAVRDFIKSPETQQRLASDSMLTKDLDSPALTRFLAGELRRWKALVQDAG